MIKKVNDSSNNYEIGIRYGIMANPGHNRVYFESAKLMALGELEIASRCFSVTCEKFESMQIEGLFYLTFIAAAPLEGEDLRLLSRLSFIYAIFILRPISELAGQFTFNHVIQSDKQVSNQTVHQSIDGLNEDSIINTSHEVIKEEKQAFTFHSNTVMIPIQQIKTGVLGEDISTILKYSGKTNELFTRMMMNVGVMSGDYVHERKLSVLDPLSGKGTTLFEAALSGWDASGIELSDKSVQEARAFFKKYLETGKYKHSSTRERLSGKNKVFRSEVTSFEYSVSKEAQKSGEKQFLTFIEGDSRFANEYFKREQFHLIVADLPYGVQHGSKSGNLETNGRYVKNTKSSLKDGYSNQKSKGENSNQGFSSLTRNPKDLIKSCLPAWIEVLKPGGTIVLAWNRYVLAREELAELFQIKGLIVMEMPPYLGFEHQVDQSILRDLIVIKKL